MRFFADGPNIPDELLVARDDARVVFFCGAGVSKAYAGLPTFVQLANDVLSGLGSLPGSEERRLLDAMVELEERGLSGLVSADRIFTVLEKNFDRQQIGREIAKSLRGTSSPNLRAHRILLDLATHSDGSSRLVTTNFDRLFEACDPSIRSVSRSELPRVKHVTGDWGIVHLHGAIKEDLSGPDDDGLVLSSAEFGDAYLADGWARDFVREILDGYAAVFIGYAADDPPVRYLLEGLQQSHSADFHLYAFHNGPNDEALARWDDKGVIPISYSAQDRAHSVLYRSLDAWAKRARDPSEWRKKVFQFARKSPALVPPHKRGMLAHIVKTRSGAIALSKQDPPVSPEWICVFDPHIRYGEPAPRKGSFTDSELVDPFKRYGLDDDPPPPERNDQFSKRGEIPTGAWDAFAISPSDKANLTYGHISTLRGLAAANPPQLPTRLSALGDWIAKSANKVPIVWWAGRQHALHAEIRRGVGLWIDGRNLTATKTVREAWRLLFDVFDLQRADHIDEVELRGAIENGGWTPDLIRRHARLMAPSLKRRSFLSRPCPPKGNEKIRRHDLIDVSVEYPETALTIPIPDNILAPVVAGWRANLEVAIDLELEKTRWLRVSPIEPDDRDDESYERNHDLSGYTITFANLFRRLMEQNSEVARTEFLRWRDSDRVFQQLRVWAASFSNLTSPKEFAGVIASLSIDEFWDSYIARDLLLALAKRWGDLDRPQKIAIEHRLTRGPSKYGSEDDDEFRQRSAASSLSRLLWLSKQGCVFALNLEELKKQLVAEVPDWRPEWADHAADSLEGRSGFVKTETDPANLVGVPISKIVPTVRKLEGRSDDLLVERDPFAGLTDTSPLRAISALSRETKTGAVPTDLWETFLSREGRKSDTLRRMKLIAGRLAQLSSTDFSKISLTASRWFEKAGPAMRDDTSSLVFARLWQHFINTLSEKAEAASSALVRKEHGTDVDWVSEAINASAGNLAQLIMTDPLKEGLKEGQGFPTQWLDQVEQLLTLPGESRRYALTIFAFNLRWFFWVDPDYTESTFLSVLEGAGDKEDRDAIWAGFFWGASTPQEKLFIRLKPQLLQIAKEGTARRRRHSEILSGILLAGWGSTNGSGERYISTAELHAVLLDADENFRSHMLWQLDRWSSQENWSAKLVEFLRTVWPKHKKARTPAVSARLVELAIDQEAVFPEVVAAVIPLLGRPEPNSLAIYRLKKTETAIMERYPAATLDLLYAMLSEDTGQWPWGARDVVAELSRHAPALANNPKMTELLGRIDLS